MARRTFTRKKSESIWNGNRVGGIKGKLKTCLNRQPLQKDRFVVKTYFINDQSQMVLDNV